MYILFVEFLGDTMSTMRSQSGAVNGKYTIPSRDGIAAVQGVIDKIEVQRREAVRTKNPDSARIYAAVLIALRAVIAAGQGGIALTEISSKIQKSAGRSPFSRNQLNEVTRIFFAYMAPIQAKEVERAGGQQAKRPANQPPRPTQRHSAARQRLDHGKLK